MNLEATSSMVQFPSNTSQGTTEAFLATPKAKGKYPGVILIHEIWGLVDHIKDVSTRLARQGYATLAVDLFEGKTLTKLEDGRKLREKLMEEKILSDLNAGHAYLKNLENVKPKHIGSIGFCMGGGLSLLFACHNQEIAAGILGILFI